LLLIEAAILHTQADLRVVELAEDAAATLAYNVAGEEDVQDRPDAAAERR
jgi:hypothetical protein